jgi:hypothetical protein
VLRFCLVYLNNCFNYHHLIIFLWRRAPQQMLWTHRSLEACCATLWWIWLVFFVFPCNVAPVKWNWQGKTKVLGGKPVPVPLCPPQIPHGLTRDRTRASAVEGRRLTAWAMARSSPLMLVRHFTLKALQRMGKLFRGWSKAGQLPRSRRYGVASATLRECP